MLQSTDKDGTGTSTYDGYDVIGQQSAGNGTTCTLVQQADGSYVAAGACPVPKWQPGQTGDSRQSYFYRILVTGYIADGRFYSLADVISSKDEAMTYTGNVEAPASRVMEVTISKISVPSVEFDPNGGTLPNGYIVVGKNGTVTAGQINARIPEWEGHTFDAWYTEAEGGARQTEDIINITGKQTLYAHWKMVVDPARNAPTANDLTYNGKAQALVTRPVELPAGCEKIEYSLGGVDWTDDPPTAVDAGAYTVKVRYVGDGAHAYADGADVQVTVKPKPITDGDVKFNGPADFAYVYATQATGDAMPQGPIESVSSTLASGSLSLSNGTEYTVEGAPQYDVGSYTMVVKGMGNFCGEVTQAYSIKKATFEGDLEEAYKPTVNKTDGKDGLVYNAGPQTLVNAPTSLPAGYVEVRYSIDGGKTWAIETPTATDAGDYTVQVRYVGDRSHEDFTIFPLTARIVKRCVKIQGDSNTVTYNGAVQRITGYSANVSGGPDDAEGLADQAHRVTNLSYPRLGHCQGRVHGRVHACGRVRGQDSGRRRRRRFGQLRSHAHNRQACDYGGGGDRRRNRRRGGHRQIWRRGGRRGRGLSG